MTGNELTHETKRHPVIVALKVVHSNLEISRFLKIAKSFACKVCKELETEDGNILRVSKCKKAL